VSDRDLLTNAFETARRAAIAGGAVVRRYFGRQISAIEKRGSDLVTEVDLAAEETIVALLRAAHPEFGVLSEERGASDIGSAYTWVVDPLDGTNNFVADIPQVGVSIALLRGDEALIGVVYQPIVETLWWAQRGTGAYRDGEVIHAPHAVEPRRAVVAWVQGYPVPTETATRYHHALQGRVKRLLTNWAPALDWCLLAEGRIDALVSLDSEREDQAAGLLIAREAGAIVTDLSGRPITSETTRVLASGDARLHEALRIILDGVSLHDRQI